MAPAAAAQGDGTGSCLEGGREGGREGWRGREREGGRESARARERQRERERERKKAWLGVERVSGVLGEKGEGVHLRL